MKITICGSIAFFNQMKTLQDQLEQLGHEVQIPKSEFADPKGDIVPALEFRKLKKSR